MKYIKFLSLLWMSLYIVGCGANFKTNTVESDVAIDNNTTQVVEDAPATNTPVTDKIAPVITLNDKPTLSIILGENYDEKGATVIDNYDQNIQLSISGDVDTHKIGRYQITYSATDKAGNRATVTRSINIIPPLYKTEIHKAFNTHYEYFTKQMHKRLEKDPDGCGTNSTAAAEGGCSDTYVLYDVQTYMQNAIIYADEQDDTEIIEKLLTLVLIPFEERYISKDGLWLNNKDEVPRYRKLWGVEVELPLTQYFSLLTRVLSSAQRHNVPTSITQREIKIIIDHIDKWINTIPLPPTYTKLSDIHMFKIQSALQFADYASQSGIEIEDLDQWKRMVQDYIKLQIKPKWEKVDCKDENGNFVDNCLALWRMATPANSSYAYSGYGLELTKTSSDTDPNAMFDAEGWVKHPPKRAKKVGADVSHGRRFNWLFETVKRFGTPFKVAISEEKLQGWANNLAYRVSVGTVDDPKFTIFCDGVDGWYRVNYNGGKGPRAGFGYASGDMDIHFVASSYGMFGVYNPKIYTWMKAWAEKHESKMNGYNGGYKLDFYTSMAINMKK